MRRLTALLIVICAVAGCGGDEGGAAPSSGGGAALSAIPADLPVVIEVSADLESDQWESALAFAERLDPSDRDLNEALTAELFDGDVAYEEVQGWLGESAALGLSGVKDGEISGVFAFEVTDEEAARKTLEKDTQGEPRTYEEVEYFVDPEDGSTSGLLDGLAVGASDEASFKAAVDATKGGSVAEDGTYQEALDQAPDDRLMTAYADVDGVLGLLADSGSVPPETLEQVRHAPGFENASSVVASLVAEDDAMTLEVAAPGVDEVPEGPTVADLPGGAWFALVGDGSSFGDSFMQSFEQSGGPEAVRIAEELGLTAFLEGLETMSVRLGGTSIGELNGALELTGADEEAARNLIQRSARELKVLGAPVQLEGDRATINVPPVEVRAEADGGTVRVAAGAEPEGSLSDDETFSAAAEAIGLDQIVVFTDFAPLEELLRSLPSDPDLEEGLAVLRELGYFVVGAGEEDGTVLGRFVLTLR